MYKVAYYFSNTNMVKFEVFDSFKEASDFCLKQPRDSIIEIKYYDDKVDNIQNESNDYGPY